jgi:single-stranded-DNA-specific exonuclease
VRWHVHDPVAVPAELREAVGGHPLLAMLLAQRGITAAEAARRFLDPALYSPTCPLALPGVCAAKRILSEAALTRAAVRIWGDLDADGQTSTAVLYEALTALGCRVDYRIPSRALGHGFPPSAVQEAARDGVRVIVTCDTGVTDVATVALANDLGLATIITDHHDLGEVLPGAAAIVNPKLLSADHPARELSGVGVAYMVACALLDAPRFAPILEGMRDLVALGLVADVATQVGDVRYWIQQGLAVLRQGRRPGLVALMNAAGVEAANADEQSVGYQLAPRMNAAGRLGDANDVVELLLTPSAERAAELAGAIDALNADRRARTEAMYARVEGILQRDPDALHAPALIAAAADLEEGVIGLVAGRLAQTFGRPALVIAHRPGKVSVGSARSVEGIDIHAAIASQRQHLLREGGHPMAAGFALEPALVDTFTQGLLAWLRAQAPVAPTEPALEIDAVIPWHEITLSLAQQLQRLGPFGPGNRQPLLATFDSIFLRSEDVNRKRETAHRRLFVSGPQGEPHRLIWFNAGELPAPGEVVDLAFVLQVNRYAGREEPQLRFEDWRPAQPTAELTTPPIVNGVEVVDWRQEPSAADLVAKLQGEFEQDLLLYPAGASSLSPRVALAFAGAPSSPDQLRALLGTVQPQVIYLLPVGESAASAPGECLQLMGGMVRLAQQEREGRLDVARMAAAAGQADKAVYAALEWLVAAGKVALYRTAEGLIATELGATPPAGAEPAFARADAQMALTRLSYALREAAAYRRAWATMAVTALLARD